MPVKTMAWPEEWITLAISWPRSRLTPGMKRASVLATCSKVLWLSLRTITRQASPRPPPGGRVLGSSTVRLTRDRIKPAARPYNHAHEQYPVSAAARARPSVDDAHVRRPLD